ncbi:DUF2400 family protein, partial [bacterium AH-315-P07]|nr:DUF2400 family protein [bacterium AH-315-P07]
MNRQTLHQHLNTLNARCHKFKYIHPDPLEFVHQYSSPGDQEIVGLFSAVLAYGRVAQILKSIRIVLEPMGSSPQDYVLGASDSRLRADFESFQHRWTRGGDIIQLMRGIRSLLSDYDSLEFSFLHHLDSKDTDTISA